MWSSSSKTLLESKSKVIKHNEHLFIHSTLKISVLRTMLGKWLQGRSPLMPLRYSTKAREERRILMCYIFFSWKVKNEINVFSSVTQLSNNFKRQSFWNLLPTYNTQHKNVMNFCCHKISKISMRRIWQVLGIWMPRVLNLQHHSLKELAILVPTPLYRPIPSFVFQRKKLVFRKVEGGSETGASLFDPQTF